MPGAEWVATAPARVSSDQSRTGLREAGPGASARFFCRCTARVTETGSVRLHAPGGVGDAVAVASASQVPFCFCCLRPRPKATLQRSLVIGFLVFRQTKVSSSWAYSFLPFVYVQK